MILPRAFHSPATLAKNLVVEITCTPAAVVRVKAAGGYWWKSPPRPPGRPHAAFWIRTQEEQVAGEAVGLGQVRQVVGRIEPAGNVTRQA